MVCVNTCGPGWVYGKKRVTALMNNLLVLPRRCKLRCEKVLKRRKKKRKKECFEFIGARTPEDVVLVVLVGFSPHFYQARQSLSYHKLVHQVLVILKRGQKEKEMTN